MHEGIKEGKKGFVIVEVHCLLITDHREPGSDLEPLYARDADSVIMLSEH